MPAYDELGKILVIIPTYNEKDNVVIAVDQVRQHAPTVDILVADDNSPDGTGTLADEMAANDSQVYVLHRDGKQGLGAAYIHSFKWARQRGYNVVVEMDADGSHRAQDLPHVLGALVDADVALGSRWVRGGKVENWPMHRELLSRGGNIYTKLWLGMPVSDATGGFRAFRMSALDAIGIDDVQSQGYCFQVDMAWRAVQSGLKIVEVPITFIERVRGESKMDQAIVKEALTLVTVWGLNKRKNDLRRLFRRATN